MRLHVMFCRCNVRRSTSTRRLPRKSSGSRARPASRRPTTRNSHWQNCARFWQEPSPMSSRRFVTTERCCRYPHARDTSPRISDLPSERERAFQVFIDVLLAASRKRPILVIVEDVQWMDPTTIELLVRVIARCSGERIMVLITHRDDYRPTGCRARQFDGLPCKSWRRTNASRWSQPSQAAISCRAGLPARSWKEPMACRSSSRSLRGP